MTFVWNDKTTKWMVDAAEYTGFYKNIASMILPYIKERGTLCDMGCGMALTDMELSKYIGNISCIDKSAGAIDFAKKESARRGITNMDIQCGDAMNKDGSWDTVMAMFHGLVDVVMIPYLTRATDRLIFVTHGADTNHGPGFCENAATAAQWLDSHGFKYTRQDARLEFGQPHLSIQDAIDSTLAYHKGMTQDRAQAIVMESIQETGRSDFPYYTPKTRSFAIFDIPRKGNEGLI